MSSISVLSVSSSSSTAESISASITKNNMNNANKTNKPMIVSIEGNIGAGKTTILHHLEKYYQRCGDDSVVFVREPVDEWEQICDGSGETVLSKFYRDPAKYAFPFQIMAYATRLSVIRQAMRENPGCRVLVCERSLEADKHIFANMLHRDGLIEQVNYQIYCKFFGEYAEDLNLDRVVYIDADAEVCFRRIGQRSREGESKIELAYLEKCGKYHREWLVENKENNAMQLLHLKTNEDVRYSNDDVGMDWIKQIAEFIL